jgi:hypothetical protein
MRDYEYELDKSTGEMVKRYVDMINNDGFKKVIKMWNYRIIKRASDNEPECYYSLNEVFYEKDGTLMAFSDADQVVGSSREEIIEVLEMMLADAKKDRPVLTEADFKV